MKIITNNIGNYGPRQISEVNHIKRTTELEQDTKAEKVSTDEKKFFMELYPQNKTEITNYHFYQKTGKMSGVSLGSLLDRRG